MPAIFLQEMVAMEVQAVVSERMARTKSLKFLVALYFTMPKPANSWATLPKMVRK